MVFICAGFILPLLYVGALISIFAVGKWLTKRRFQIHLSTLLALTIVTGGLIGLNIKPIRIGNEIGWPFLPFDPTKIWQWIDIGDPAAATESQREMIYERWWGWPLAAEKPWFWKLDGDAWPELDIALFWNFNFVTCLGIIAWTIYVMESKFGKAKKPGNERLN